MEHKNNSQYGLNSVELDYTKPDGKISNELVKTQPHDPQVKASGVPSRKFTAEYKQRILIAYDACTNPLERGELLRREALYSTHISSWRRLFKPDNEGKKGSGKAQRVDHLVNEIEQLKKKLAQAHAIIDLQKKVSELLGTYILPHDSKGGIL